MTEYSPAKIGEYPRTFPNFENCARCEKDAKNNKHNSLHLGRKYARVFALGHYLFFEAHSFPGATLSETVRFSKQIMSADKYPTICLCQMEAIVYIELLHLRSSTVIEPAQRFLSNFAHWEAQCNTEERTMSNALNSS